jgi:biopolymer transport protein ExbD
MKFRRPKRHVSEVSAGALTDIMFFLLLFFLIMSTITNPNVIKILLPESAAPDAINQKDIIVTITKEHEFLLDAKPIEEADLPDALKARVTETKLKAVRLQCDREVPVSDMVKMIDLGKKLGIDLVLETTKPGS